MHKVNNRKTINKLVKGSIKEYKMRNFFVLVTIVLSVSLIAGFAFLSLAEQEITQKELNKRQHVLYENVNSKSVKLIQNHPQVSYNSELKRGKSFEVEDYHFIPMYMEQNGSPMTELTILEGNYPKEPDEVLVHDKMLRKMGVEAKVLEKISITYLDGTTEEYVVSGILKAEDTDVFPLYLSREYAVSGSQLKDIPFELAVQIVDAPKMSSEAFVSLVRQIGRESGLERKDINENNTFVKSLSYDKKEIMMISLVALAVLFVSVLVIYSIFYISISERVRYFGQLKTIGMTEKQIKRMVRKEGTVLSMIGGVIGIAIGGTFAFTMKPEGFDLGMFLVYATAILAVNNITVWFAIATPAKIAAGIAPIEAARTSGYEKKEQETKKLCRKLSSLSLSMIAVRGNRRKSIMTICSLCLAGIVFMCGGSFMKSIDEEKFSRQGEFEYGEFVIDISSNASQVDEYGEMGVKRNNPLSQALISQFKEIEYVKEVLPTQMLSTSYTYKDVTSQDIVLPFTEEEGKEMQQYLKEGEVDYDKMGENKEILIARNDLAKEIFGWQFKMGDTVTLEWFNGQEIVEDTFRIGGILDKSSKMLKNQKIARLISNTGWFLLPQEVLSSMMEPDFNLNASLVISCKDYEKNQQRIEDEIRTIVEENPLLTLSTLRSAMEHHKKQFQQVYATFMGAALFVITFSIINMLNTIISNTMARKREFACLSALGAGKKQIQVMILGEGVYFAVINLVSTVVIGSVCGYFAVKLSQLNGVGYLKYRYPFEYFLAYSLFVVVVTGAISGIITKIISKKSLVERMREAE